MPRWRIDITGKELQALGTVDAPNAWEALAKAVGRSRRRGERAP